MGYIRDNDDFDAANPNYSADLHAALAKARKDIEELQARLIQRTEESLATAQRDARRIGELESAARDLIVTVRRLAVAIRSAPTPPSILTKGILNECERTATHYEARLK